MAKRKQSLKAQIYASFRDDVAFSIRDMKEFIKQGGSLDTVEITAILDKLFINLAYELEANDIENAEDVLVRAEDYLNAAQVKFLELPIYAKAIEENLGEDNLIDINEGFILIGGKDYAIVDPNSSNALQRAGIKRRGRTIKSFSELIEYVEDIPTVYGIEFVYTVTGIIKGYRVWVADKS